MLADLPIAALVTGIIILFLCLLAIRIPVAIGLGVSGLIGVSIIRSPSAALSTLGSIPFQVADSVSLMIVPLFILMGLFAVNGGLAEDAFGSAQRLLHRFPGGLGLATLGGCGLFAAVTGSSVATVATMGRISIRAMAKFGYPIRFAAGLVGAGGTLGVLIPPSIILVMYGIVTGESIGFLLIAGLIPGLLSLAIYCLVALGWGFRHERQLASAEAAMAHSSREPAGSPDEPSDGASTETSSNDPMGAAGTFDPQAIPVKISSLIQLGALFFVAIGTIYLGVATPTEAASLGALFAGILLVVRKARSGRSGDLRSSLANSLFESASLTSMVFFLLLGAALFTYFLSLSGATRTLTQSVVDTGWAPIIVLIVALLLLIPLGMFLDGISIILIISPLLYPIVVGSFGFDGIWFGILMVKMIEIGLITPPIGLNAYVLSGVVPELELSDAFKGLLVFVPADLATVGILLAFPEITLWLPRTMGY